MGYPMDYTRVVSRNNLHGDYVHPVDDRSESVRGMIAGDLRRLEKDQRDDRHIHAYAKVAGCTKKQAKAVLDAFFECDVRLRAETVGASK